MFEYSCLQEAYTGALLAAKGRNINGISTMMARTKFKHEDWIQIRFNAGQPWMKCWAVITPPDEKAFQKQKKAMAKQMKLGGTTDLPHLIGDIKFYASNKKIKKATPIATIKSAYACYAIYPQSKQLIDHSTLIKIEGQIEHNQDEVAAVLEGFVFVMPDPHAGVANIETMFRWLIRAFDVFALYGRPGRLIADTNNPNGIMFAFSSTRKYGVLETSDVAALLLSDAGAQTSEAAIRRKLKLLVKERLEFKRANRNSMPITPRMSTIQFEDNRSSASSSPVIAFPPSHVPGSAPQAQSTSAVQKHTRAQSEMTNFNPKQVQHRQQQSHTSSAPDGIHNPKRRNHSSLKPDSPQQPKGKLSQFDYAAAQQPDVPIQDIPKTPAMEHAPSSRPDFPVSKKDPSAAKRMSMGTLEAMGLAGAGAAVAMRKNEQQRQQALRPQSPQEEQEEEEDMFAEMGTSAANSAAARDPSNPRNALKRALYTPPVMKDSRPYGAELPPVKQKVTTPPADKKEKEQPTLLVPKPVKAGTERAPVLDRGPSVANALLKKPAPLPRWSVMTDSGSEPMTTTTDYSWKRDDDRSMQRVPPLPAKIPEYSSTDVKMSDISIQMQAPTPSTANATPSTAASENSEKELEDRFIDRKALARVHTHKRKVSAEDPDKFDPPSDEDSLDRRELEKLVRATGMLNQQDRSESEYDSESEVDDYASTIDSNDRAQISNLSQRREITPRTGVIKTVGNNPAPDVRIGDTKYVRPQSRQALSEDNILNINFGKTANHSRNLSGQSTDTIGKNYEELHTPDGKYKRQSSHGALDSGRPTESRGSGGSSGDSNRQQQRKKEERPREESKRRSMAWQPGLVQNFNQRPDMESKRQVSAEQFVQERAEKATAESRSRYLNNRRPSADLLSRERDTPNSSSDNLPPQRPKSRNGLGSFLPPIAPSGPLISNVGTQLSAQEQQYVAKLTGSTLVQLDKDTKKPPHQAGLLGAIESREREKNAMKQEWGNLGQASMNNRHVQNAVAGRLAKQQQEEMEREAARYRRSNSPGPEQAYLTRSHSPGPQQAYLTRSNSPGPQQAYQNYGKAPSTYSMGASQFGSREQLGQYSAQGSREHLSQYPSSQFHTSQQSLGRVQSPTPPQQPPSNSYFNSAAQLQQAQQKGYPPPTPMSWHSPGPQTPSGGKSYGQLAQQGRGYGQNGVQPPKSAGYQQYYGNGR